jgi:DNA-binding CsgD family transcriptional regulator
MSRPPKKPNPPRPHAGTGDPLTNREIQILALVAAGEPTPAISRRLGIAENTIKTHLTSVYRKTGCRNRVQATRHYLDNYTSAPPTEADRSRDGARDTSLIQRQMAEIQARLDHLANAATEAERLQHALKALRAIEGNWPERRAQLPRPPHRTGDRPS